MNKIKVFLLLTVMGLLSFNFANAAITITRGTSGGGASGTFTIRLTSNDLTSPYTEVHSFTSDAQSIVYTGAQSLVNHRFSITIEGITRSIWQSDIGAGYQFTADQFDFSTYGYGVYIYPGSVAGTYTFQVTKFFK